MKTALGLLALLGLLLSLTAHLAALIGIDVLEFVPFVWVLHVGIFVVFVPFVLIRGREPGSLRNAPLTAQEFPRWVVKLGAALFIYTFVNFLLFVIATEGGSPEIRGGKFVLQDHGKFIRELTAQEYSRSQANIVRGFSGHWMLFYFVPCAYFLFRKGPDAMAPPPVANNAGASARLAARE